MSNLSNEAKIYIIQRLNEQNISDKLPDISLSTPLSVDKLGPQLYTDESKTYSRLVDTLKKIDNV